MTKYLYSLALVMLVLPLVAHHGTSVSYDDKKVVKITGIVKEFIWRNPHSALCMEGKDASGKTVEYAIEMGSPNSLAKQGLRPRQSAPALGNDPIGGANPPGLYRISVASG